LKEHIKFYVESERTDWDKYVATSIYTYNNDFHSSTGSSPYCLMLGRDPNLPYLQDQEDATYEEYFTTTKNKLMRLVKLDARTRNVYKRNTTAKK